MERNMKIDELNKSISSLKENIESLEVNELKEKIEKLLKDNLITLNSDSSEVVTFLNNLYLHNVLESTSQILVDNSIVDIHNAMKDGHKHAMTSNLHKTLFTNILKRFIDEENFVNDAFKKLKQLKTSYNMIW